MTTIKELIDLLTCAGKKLGYNMPVILEPNIDCIDADYGPFPAFDVINNDIDSLFLSVKEAQRGVELDGYPPDDVEELEVAYYDYWDSEEVPESDKKKVLCISSPAFKYGAEENDF
jgi:hypothetical protein